MPILDTGWIDRMTAARMTVSFNFTATLNATLLTGRQVTTVSVPGLLTSDRLVEVQPVGNLPGSLTIGYGVISANDTLQVAFTTPIAYTGNSDIQMLVTVLR